MFLKLLYCLKELDSKIRLDDLNELIERYLKWNIIILGYMVVKQMF